MGQLVMGAALAAAAAGCGKQAAPPEPWPRLLEPEEVARYLAAEEALNFTDRSLADVIAMCTLQREEITPELARFSVTPEAFMELAELVFLARHGRELFAELPRKKRALTRALLQRCRGPEDEPLRKRLEAELREQTEAESAFVTRVLANVHLLEQYANRRPEAGGGRPEAGWRMDRSPGQGR
jgi:hypothetical protein